MGPQGDCKAPYQEIVVKTGRNETFMSLFYYLFNVDLSHWQDLTWFEMNIKQ